MRTFWISTLGCKVNQYESEQIAALLRSRGLIEAPAEQADLHIVNTCSVTIQAASKSRQLVRRSARPTVPATFMRDGSLSALPTPPKRLIVTGCWATSDKAQAAQLPGVDAVLGHRDNLADELHRLLTDWTTENREGEAPAEPHHPGTLSLPLLTQHQSTHQRAFLKIQDGCDAHCTYCIIPKLRPTLWSKPLDQAVAEAQRLVAAGHTEIVLTGIFLGAYGHSTALHRRQSSAPQQGTPLAQLIHSLCTQVPGLRRLRLSSLEPADLTDDLVDALRRHPQLVPHFHLPLQSGSDLLLRRMNRQYSQADYLRMIARLRQTFDRPAITTDIIVGFPGETDEEFQQTLAVIEAAQFIHIHAFPYSPRPGTAAARWSHQFIHGPIVNHRIQLLQRRAADHSFAFRSQFLGQVVEVLVERPSEGREREAPAEPHLSPNLRHGRCERYFPIFFEGPPSLIGRPVRVRIDRVTRHRTLGTLVHAV